MSTPLVLEKHPVSSTIVLDSKAPDKIIWPIAGGKGGTGKSTLTANIGVGLSLLGYKVILVDGDLGGANLHLFFDLLAPSRNLGSFLVKEIPLLADVVLPTPSENLKLICGGNELIGLANLPFGVKQKLVRYIASLEADYVLIDLGAGTSFNTLDFFTMSSEGLIICTPEPHARVDAYGFVKNTIYRKLHRQFAKNPPASEIIDRFARNAGSKSGRIGDLLDQLEHVDSQAGGQARQCLKKYQPKLLLNKVRNKRQIEDAHRFLALVDEYLSVKMEYVGYVRSDQAIVQACERRRPLLLDNPKAAAAQDLYKVLMCGLNVADRRHRFSADNSRKMAALAKAESRLWR